MSNPYKAISSAIAAELRSDLANIAPALAREVVESLSRRICDLEERVGEVEAWIQQIRQVRLEDEE